MDAHDGVNTFDGLPTDSVTCRARAVGLRNSAVHGVEALEVLLEAGAE